jgi:hypothetical protein
VFTALMMPYNLHGTGKKKSEKSIKYHQ